MGVWILLVVGVAIMVSLPFLPSIHTFSSEVANNTNINGTPLEPLINLWPLWVLMILIVAVAWVISRKM